MWPSTVDGDEEILGFLNFADDNPINNTPDLKNEDEYNSSPDNPSLYSNEAPLLVEIGESMTEVPFSLDLNFERPSSWWTAYAEDLSEVLTTDQELQTTLESKEPKQTIKETPEQQLLPVKSEVIVAASATVLTSWKRHNKRVKREPEVATNLGSDNSLETSPAENLRKRRKTMAIAATEKLDKVTETESKKPMTPKEQKLEQRKEKNRQAAQRCRERKEEYYRGLEQEAVELRVETGELKAELIALEKQLAELRELEKVKNSVTDVKIAKRPKGK